ncbi:MAG: hypothetical protein V9E96_00430 [Chitinophagaceae bacterium]
MGLNSGSSYTVNFIKGGVSQPAQTISAIGGNVVIPNLSAGAYTNITVTLNGCISNIVAASYYIIRSNTTSNTSCN